MARLLGFGGRKRRGCASQLQWGFGLPNVRRSGTPIIHYADLLDLFLDGESCRPAVGRTGVSQAATTAAGIALLASWHFVGGEAVNASTNGGTLKSLLALPESQALREQTLDKLALAPFAHLKSRWAYSTNDCGELLRPLFADLLSAESYFEMRGLSNQPPEWTLAVRLPAAAAERWLTNLETTVQTWTQISPTNITGPGYSGWRLKKHHSPDLLGVVLAQDWVLVGAGNGVALDLHAVFARRIHDSGRPVAVEVTIG